MNRDLLTSIASAKHSRQLIVSILICFVQYSMDDKLIYEYNTSIYEGHQSSQKYPDFVNFSECK